MPSIHWYFSAPSTKQSALECSHFLVGICEVLEKWDRLANTLEVSAKWSSYKSLQGDSFMCLSNSAFNINQSDPPSSHLLQGMQIKVWFHVRNALRMGKWKLFGGLDTEVSTEHWVLLVLVLWAVSGLLIRQRHASDLLKLAKKGSRPLSLGGHVKIMRRGNGMGAKFAGWQGQAYAMLPCNYGRVRIRFA